MVMPVEKAVENSRMSLWKTLWSDFLAVLRRTRRKDLGGDHEVLGAARELS